MSSWEDLHRLITTYVCATASLLLSLVLFAISMRRGAAEKQKGDKTRGCLEFRKPEPDCLSVAASKHVEVVIAAVWWSPLQWIVTLRLGND